MRKVVIFHCGCQDYFVECVTQNSKYNFVYLIGDESNCNIFSSNQNVKHILMNNLNSPDIERFKKCFINYSTNPHNYEMFCFLRIFYIYNLLIKEGLNDIFHLDSDCVLYESLENITFNKGICYSLQTYSQAKNELHMVGCVHNALLNREFCQKFIELCYNIYENKSKLYLIEPKIKWHVDNGVNGGICDMTLYYLMHSENLVEVEDLNNIFIVNGEKCTFDHNLSCSYGFDGEETYLIKNGIKVLTKKYDEKNNKIIYANREDGEKIRLLSIHFQGNKKRFIGIM